MLIEHVRRLNLIVIYEMIREAKGGQFTWKEFAKEMGKNKTLISQYKNGTPIGSNACREIESFWKLPEGFMDDSSNTKNSKTHKQFLSTVISCAFDLNKNSGIEFDPDELADFITQSFETFSESPGFSINEKIIRALLISKFK